MTDDYDDSDYAGLCERCKRGLSYNVDGQSKLCIGCETELSEGLAYKQGSYKKVKKIIKNKFMTFVCVKCMQDKRIYRERFCKDCWKQIK